MNRTPFRPVLLALLAAAGVAHAQQAPVVGRAIDPNTFIVGHPASPTWQVRHANGDHPAIVQARLARQAAVDPNTFLVQPPASTRWTTPDADLRLAQAAR